MVNFSLYGLVPLKSLPVFQNCQVEARGFKKGASYVPSVIIAGPYLQSCTYVISFGLLLTYFLLPDVGRFFAEKPITGCFQQMISTRVVVNLQTTVGRNPELKIYSYELK